MTAEKTISIAYAIAKNAHPDDFDFFAKGWRAFLSGPAAEAFPVFSYCAALILDAQEGMDKKASKPSKLSAAKRIISNAARDNFRGIWVNSQDLTCMCDGYRAVRLTDSFASLPVVPEWPELPRVFAEPEKYTREIELPTVAAVKKSATEQRAAEGRNCRPVFDFGDGLPMVSTNYLLDILALLPDAKCYIANNHPEISPLYFRAGNGDGVLLPVRKSARR